MGVWWAMRTVKRGTFEGPIRLPDRNDINCARKVRRDVHDRAADCEHAVHGGVLKRGLRWAYTVSVRRWIRSFTSVASSRWFEQGEGGELGGGVAAGPKGLWPAIAAASAAHHHGRYARTGRRLGGTSLWGRVLDCGSGHCLRSRSFQRYMPLQSA